MRDLRLLRPSRHDRAHLRRLQLRVISGAMRDLRRPGRIRCILLQRMHAGGKRCERARLKGERGRNVGRIIPSFSPDEGQFSCPPSTFAARRLSENHQPRASQNRHVLREEEVRLREKLLSTSRSVLLLARSTATFCYVRCNCECSALFMFRFENPATPPEMLASYKLLRGPVPIRTCGVLEGNSVSMQRQCVTVAGTCPPKDAPDCVMQPWSEPVDP